MKLTDTDHPGTSWTTKSKAEVERFVPIVLQMAEFHWKEVDAFMRDVLKQIRKPKTRR